MLYLCITELVLPDAHAAVLPGPQHPRHRQRAGHPRQCPRSGPAAAGHAGQPVPAPDYRLAYYSSCSTWIL